jgi:hypothetical protein
MSSHPESPFRGHQDFLSFGGQSDSVSNCISSLSLAERMVETFGVPATHESVANFNDPARTGEIYQIHV